MDEHHIVVDGLSLKAWKAVFRPGMPEFAATSFVFTRESKDFVRIAFGNKRTFPRSDKTKAHGARVRSERYGVSIHGLSRSVTLRDDSAWILPRSMLPDGSLSARLRAGAASVGPQELDADIWFDSWWRGATLLEDAQISRPGTKQ